MREKYKIWYDELRKRVTGEFSTVTIDGVGNSIGKDELLVSLRALSSEFNCSNKTVYRFIDFLISEKYISKRIIGCGNKKKTVITFLKKQNVHISNADEQGVSGDFDFGFLRGLENKMSTKVTLMNKGIQGVWESEESDFLKKQNVHISNADKQRGLAVFNNIPKNLLSKKAVEMIEAHPEIVNKGITRWINSKLKKQTQTVNVTFTKCRDVYFDFYKSKNDDVPPKFSGVDGAKLKSIIKYLESVVIGKQPDLKDNESAISENVVLAFQLITNGWDKLDPFWQKNISLSAIDSNINTLIHQIKNYGKSTTKTKKQLADEKYINKQREFLAKHNGTEYQGEGETDEHTFNPFDMGGMS